MRDDQPTVGWATWVVLAVMILGGYYALRDWLEWRAHLRKIGLLRRTPTWAPPGWSWVVRRRRERRNRR